MAIRICAYLDRRSIGAHVLRIERSELAGGVDQHNPARALRPAGKCGTVGVNGPAADNSTAERDIGESDATSTYQQPITDNRGGSSLRKQSCGYCRR